MKELGWQVEKIDKWYAFIRKIPIWGSFIKIQRIKPPIPFDDIEKLKKNYRAFTVKIDLDIVSGDKTIASELIKHHYKNDNFPTIPTKTIQIDLTRSEKQIFDAFSGAKRRAVRKAIKNGIIIKDSNDFQSFINIRKRQNFPMGFLLVKEMRALWKNFYPKKASLLLAYHRHQRLQTIHNIVATDRVKPIAGILLLFCNKIAYYWYASSLDEGKQLFAPSLLVWEALKSAKKRKCDFLDFEGVYDERFSDATNSWKGFSKFKEGFGGTYKTYIGSFRK